MSPFSDGQPLTARLSREETRPRSPDNMVAEEVSIHPSCTSTRRTRACSDTDDMIHHKSHDWKSGDHHAQNEPSTVPRGAPEQPIVPVTSVFIAPNSSPSAPRGARASHSAPRGPVAEPVSGSQTATFVFISRVDVSYDSDTAFVPSMPPSSHVRAIDAPT